MGGASVPVPGEHPDAVDRVPGANVRATATNPVSSSTENAAGMQSHLAQLQVTLMTRDASLMCVLPEFTNSAVEAS